VEAAPDCLFWHRVATAANAIPDSLQSKLGAGKHEKHDVEQIALLDQLHEPSSVRLASKGGLEGKGGPTVSEFFNPAKHDFACRQGGACRIKGSQALGDEVGVYELRDSQCLFEERRPGR
jgi:hypothetical protein